MTIDKEFFDQLLKYLTSRPWVETNHLVVRLLQAKKADETPPKKEKLTNPRLIGKSGNGAI